MQAAIAADDFSRTGTGARTMQTSMPAKNMTLTETPPGRKTAILHSLIRQRKVKLTSHHKGASIEIEYPYFVCKPKELTHKLNMAVKRHVNGHMPGCTGKPSDEPGKEYTYMCSYGDSFNDTNLISVEFYFWRYTGQTHGYGHSVPFNFQITGRGIKQLTLKDIFGNRFNYQILRDLCRTELYKNIPAEFADESSIKEGTENASYLADFTFDKKGITFHFGAYQVACYMAGSQSARFSWGQLRSIVPRSSPVYRFALASKDKALALDPASRQRALDKALAILKIRRQG